MEHKVARGQGEIGTCQKATTTLDKRPTGQRMIDLTPVIAAFAVLFLMWVLNNITNPFYQNNLERDHLRHVPVTSEVSFDGQFRLLGYDALPRRVRSGDCFEAHLYWQDSVPGGVDYRPLVTVRDETGILWSNKEVRFARWYRPPPSPRFWPPDHYALLAYTPCLFTGIPPGKYVVMVEVFDKQTGAIFAAQDRTRFLGTEIPLGTIQVVRPSRVSQEIPAQRLADAPAGPVRLVGYGLDREGARPGDPFLLTLFWRTEETPGEELWLRLHLRPEISNVQSKTWDLPLTSFPTTEWQEGDLWRGQHLLRLPAGLESGTYQWILEVCRGNIPACEPMGEEVSLGTLEVHAPQRLWEAPPLDIEVNACFDNVITLLGANLNPETLNPGTPLTVTLVWHAEAEMETSYRVFLHLLGPDGNIVAQSDGEPANWTRPTTGWLPGEVVLDERTISIPGELTPGEYDLVVGVYTQHFKRLVSSSGEDAVPIARIALEENEE